MNPERKAAILSALERIDVERKLIQSLIDTDQPKSHHSSVAKSVSANELADAPDIFNDSWPEAVNDSLIVDKNDASSRSFRAIQILNMISKAGVEIKNASKVLDYGCGDGTVAFQNHLGRTGVTVAYDRKDPSVISSDSRLILTSQYNDVTANSPYDVIILYDVLDHLEGVDPVEFLKSVGSLLAKNGRIFMRLHPWTARHGAHLYEYELDRSNTALMHLPRKRYPANKAYVHLALTTDEMVKLSINPDKIAGPNLKVNRPLAFYSSLIEKSGLIVEKCKKHNTIVEPFFSGEVLDRMINVTWGGKIDHDTALKIMSLQFIDYVLKT